MARSSGPSRSDLLARRVAYRRMSSSKPRPVRRRTQAMASSVVVDDLGKDGTHGLVDAAARVVRERLHELVVVSPGDAGEGWAVGALDVLAPAEQLDQESARIALQLVIASGRAALLARLLPVEIVKQLIQHAICPGFVRADVGVEGASALLGRRQPVEDVSDEPVRREDIEDGFRQYLEDHVFGGIGIVEGEPVVRPDAPVRVIGLKGVQHQALAM